MNEIQSRQELHKGKGKSISKILRNMSKSITSSKNELVENSYPDHILFLDNLNFLRSVIEVARRLYRGDQDNKALEKLDKLPIGVSQMRTSELFIDGSITMSESYGTDKRIYRTQKEQEEHRASYGAVTGKGLTENVPEVEEKIKRINVKYNERYSKVRENLIVIEGKNVMRFAMKEEYGSGGESSGDDYSDNEENEDITSIEVKIIEENGEKISQQEKKDKKKVKVSNFFGKSLFLFNKCDSFDEEVEKIRKKVESQKFITDTKKFDFWEAKKIIENKEDLNRLENRDFDINTTFIAGFFMPENSKFANEYEIRGTLLHIAIIANNKEAISYLLNHGADKSIPMLKKIIERECIPVGKQDAIYWGDSTSQNQLTEKEKIISCEELAENKVEILELLNKKSFSFN